MKIKRKPVSARLIPRCLHQFSRNTTWKHYPETSPSLRSMPRLNKHFLAFAILAATAFSASAYSKQLTCNLSHPGGHSEKAIVRINDSAAVVSMYWIYKRSDGSFCNLDPTGASWLGGDWELEKNAGNVTSSALNETAYGGALSLVGAKVWSEDAIFNSTVQDAADIVNGSTELDPFGPFSANIETIDATHSKISDKTFVIGKKEKKPEVIVVPDPEEQKNDEPDTRFLECTPHVLPKGSSFLVVVPTHLNTTFQHADAASDQ